ncbi:uncharacterized protein LOC108037394 [Drosophila rhopaloa]|uniref:Uncharacterized protein n=1 Tax=Drosophila rhopaloa TaxID=1041015 RepID=A0ABM5GUD1_DRORH|nr:uncharacterized protein LOC108037394 [Drosophila rhopaloa]
MKKKRVLVVLSIMLSFIGPTLQDEEKVATPAKSDNPAPAAPPAPPVPPVPPVPPAPPVPSAKAEESSKISKQESSNSFKCKSTEILSENGCVDREYFLNRIIMRSWKDVGFGEAKEKAGLVDQMHCNDDEVRTPFGCSNPLYPPHRESNRVKVHHSRLNHNKVRHDSIHFKVSHQGDEEQKPIKKARNLGPPITGADRPRSYVFLPGRALRTRRNCRPNEVLGRRSRCIKKRTHKRLVNNNNERQM